MYFFAHVQYSSIFPDAIIEGKNGGIEPARPQHQLDGPHYGARHGGTRGNTRDAAQQPSWARGHHPLHQVREYKNKWEHTWRNTAALMGTGTPSCPSGQRVQEHVGTHVTQHNSPHGHGDTIPSIRSESTEHVGTHVTQHSSHLGHGDTIPSIRSECTRTRGNTRDATQQPSWARGHHPVHQVREYKNTWEHTWRNTAALTGEGTPSPPSGQRVQEQMGTHVMQHSSPHGHRSESTRTRGNTRDTTWRR